MEENQNTLYSRTANGFNLGMKGQIYNIHKEKAMKAIINTNQNSCIDGVYQNAVNFETNVKKTIASNIQKLIDHYGKSYLKEIEENNLQIFYSKISSIITSNPTKNARYRKKNYQIDNGFYNNILVKKIETLNINCLVFENKASEKNIQKLKNFCSENNIDIQDASRDYLSRLINISFDLGMDSLNGYNNVILNGHRYINTDSLRDKLTPWKEFKIKINFLNLSEGDLKTALTNHLNQKMKENGK